MFEMFLTAEFFSFKQTNATACQLACATDHLCLLVDDRDGVKVKCGVVDVQWRAITHINVVKELANKVFISCLDLQVL